MARLCVRGMVVLVYLVVPSLAWSLAPPQNPNLTPRVAALEEAVTGLTATVAALDTAVTMQGGQIGDLTRRIGGLEAATQLQYETVDCNVGQTVASALARHRDQLGPLTVSIVGVCREEVQIARDHVTLRGASAGDGLETSSSETVLWLSNARGVLLDQLTIRGGSTGISVSDGSSFRGNNVKVAGTSLWGVHIERGSSGFLNSCSIEGNPRFGVAVEGTVALGDCSISGNGYGVYVSDGGTGAVWGGTISQNATGIALFAHGTVRVVGSTVEHNATGINALGNSIAHVRDGSVIAYNAGTGVSVSEGSMLNIGASTQVKNNGGAGIVVDRGSAVDFADLSIIGNGGDGMSLLDMSRGYMGGEGVVITNNTGWGIYCGAPTAILPLQSELNFAGISFSGNGGETTCPRP